MWFCLLTPNFALIGQYAMRYGRLTIFNNGVRLPFWFLVTSSYYTRKLYFMSLILCWIFKSTGLVRSDIYIYIYIYIYWNFHVSALWLEIAHFGPKFDFAVIGIKFKKNNKYSDPEKAHLCVIPCLLWVKMGLISMRAWETRSSADADKPAWSV